MTRDGGKTWRAALQAPAPYGDRVGCGDVALDPVGRRARSTRPSTRASGRPWSFTSGPAAHRRQGSRRHLQVRRRRRDLEEAREGPAVAHRAHRAVASRSKNPRIVYAVVQSDEAGTNDHRRGPQQERRRLPVRRRRARPGRGRARSIRARSTSRRSASIPRTPTASTSSATRCTSPRTAASPSARTAFEKIHPDNHALRDRPAPARSASCSAPTAAPTRASTAARAGST